jgi:hypothetical protein
MKGVNVMIRTSKQDAQNYASDKMKTLSRKSIKTLTKMYYELFDNNDRNGYADELMNAIECELRYKNNGVLPDRI